MFILQWKCLRWVLSYYGPGGISSSSVFSYGEERRFSSWFLRRFLIKPLRSPVRSPVQLPDCLCGFERPDRNLDQWRSGAPGPKVSCSVFWEESSQRVSVPLTGGLPGGGFGPQQPRGSEGAGGPGPVRPSQPVHPDGLPEPDRPRLHPVPGRPD